MQADMKAGHPLHQPVDHRAGGAVAGIPADPQPAEHGGFDPVEAASSVAT
jgi:hypothetical protein